jgi:glycosyltransferase involved in cell wall biosynthesis
VKVLIISLYFPPAGGGGVQRPLKLATHLPDLGVEVHVLAPDDPKWIHTDEGLALPPHATVHRARYLGPRGRKAGEELRAAHGVQRLLLRARLLPRRLLVPDENVPWALTAIPAAIRIVRREGIDVVLTTSPPNSVHLIGAAVQRATGIKWVADLRDSLILHPHRRSESAAVRLKERTDHWVARLVARRADAVVAVSEQIADEARAAIAAAGACGEVVHIPNGSDFDDFDGLAYTPGPRFRITHAGSFFGKRDPRPFLTALKALDDPAVVARFVGDFRSADREWAEAQGFGDRLELIPYVPRGRSLELQRESEALLLLIPEAGGRGKGVLSGKVFEYLAAERPVLAAVPPDGAAAALIRDAGAGVVAAPDDPDALRAALGDLVARWRAGTLETVHLSEQWKERLSRRTNVRDLAALLARVTEKGAAA